MNGIYCLEDEPLIDEATGERLRGSGAVRRAINRKNMDMMELDELLCNQ